MKFMLFNSAKSNVGKLLNKETFEEITQSQSLRDMVEKTSNGQLELKQKLPAVSWQAWFDDGKRANKNAHPSGLFMLDLDHLDRLNLTPEDVFEKWNKHKYKDYLGVMAIQKTPSGNGIRFIAKCQPKLKLIEENQIILADELGMESARDQSTTDFARLSFLTPRDWFFYLDDKIFTDEPEVVLYNPDFREELKIENGELRIKEPSTLDPRLSTLNQNENGNKDNGKQVGTDAGSSNGGWIPPNSSSDSLFPLESMEDTGGSQADPPVVLPHRADSIANNQSVPMGGAVRRTEGSGLYKGIALMSIANKWLEQNGGVPEEGERNTKLYKLALRMRYITDFNPDKLADAIPHCGLSYKEVYSFCKSACDGRRGEDMPKDLVKAIKFFIPKFGEQETPESKKAEPTSNLDDDFDDFEQIYGAGLEAKEKELPPLPPGIREFVDIAPIGFKRPTIIACLPILGTLCSRLRARYIDNQVQSPSFQCIVTGRQASGKSFVRQLQEVLLKQMYDEDDEERRKFNEWQKFNSKHKNDKVLKDKPNGPIRIVSAKATESRLYEMMDNCKGLHMFTVTEEIDEATANMRKEALSSVLRSAYDNTRIGRDCKTAEATTVMVQFFYNTLFCGTPESVRAFFKNNPNDGSVSRTMFVNLNPNLNDVMPVWKILPKKKYDYLQKLARICMDSCRDEDGNVKDEIWLDMGYLNKALSKWLDEKRKLTDKDFSESRKVYKNRCAVNACRAGMVDDWLYQQMCPKMSVKERHKAVIEFALFVAEFTLANVTDFFPLEEYKTLINVRKNPSDNLFDHLKDEFTTDDVEHLKVKYYMKTETKAIIYKWKILKMIEKIGIRKYKKIIKKK